MYILFQRQHDGMTCRAKTRRDISKQYKQHYELLMKLRQHRATFSDADREKMAQLEEVIIENMLGANSSPFTVEEGITMLCV